MSRFRFKGGVTEIGASISISQHYFSNIFGNYGTLVAGPSYVVQFRGSEVKAIKYRFDWMFNSWANKGRVFMSSLCTESHGTDEEGKKSVRNNQ